MELPLWYMECWLYIGWVVHGENSFPVVACFFRFQLCHLYLGLLDIVGTGWGFVSNTREFGAPCNDGTCSGSPSPAYVEESWVSDHAMLLSLVFVFKINYKRIKRCPLFRWCYRSRHAEKYVRKCRLDWPEGAASRESIKAVQKLPRLQVCFPPLLYQVIFLRVGKMVMFPTCLLICLP